MAACCDDAQVILKLYDLRREEVLRKARHWLLFEFHPQSAEELIAVAQNPAVEGNAYYRQVISYWEMAASFVLRGAVDPNLYFDSQGEGLYIFAKFHAFREAIQAQTGRPFMRNTAELVEKYSAARTLLDRMLRNVQRHTPVRPA